MALHSYPTTTGAELTYSTEQLTYIKSKEISQENISYTLLMKISPFRKFKNGLVHVCRYAGLKIEKS